MAINSESTLTTIALELKNFSKRYTGNKNYSVKGASFQVEQGQFHGFIGANGAGKTTTIKSIIGAYARYQGSVLIYGQSNKKKDAKKHIGYIPEAAAFPSGFSTLSYLKNMALLSGMKSRDAHHFATDKLKELKLAPIASRNPNKLSSGQKKKVLLAQALIHQPDLLIMDEPAANLDPIARDDFFKQLTTLKKAGITIFISSHILAELEKYIDSVTIIDGGKIVYTGSINQTEHKQQQTSSLNKWLLRVYDLVATRNLMQKLAIKYRENNNDFTIEVTSATLKQLLNALISAKIKIILLQSVENNLTAIYQKYVKKGSLDLGGNHV